MTSTVTRSSRSSTKKSNTSDNALQKTVTTTLFKKKKQQQRTTQKDRSKRLVEEEQASKEEIGKHNELLLSGEANASEHPEYQKMMERLDQSYQKRLQRIEACRNYEQRAVHDWFAAQKKQAYDDFHFARMKVRSDFVQNVQKKITRLKQEIALLNRQSKIQHFPVHEENYQGWVPPERLHAIGSFVGGATNEEIDRDLMHARQPYNPNSTPHLVHSDYESKSTSDTIEEETENASSSSSNSDHYHQEQRYLPPINHSNFTTANHNNVLSYPPRPPPPYELEETPNSRPDWWPYRSTTTA